ncbi:MAG TPA: flagellar hook capping FlgD N-terminal domain-containing protein [Xanthobacteraceae bacterium]|nr:flagellar hook capping FlgD N-terminal domain-containing protein [Xanthobacteraceae bacterium]
MSTIPATTSNLFGNQTASTGNTGASTSSSSTNSSGQTNLNKQIAGNFTQFLQLLTTQLQNQNPLDPLDTNQFTQQLVEFASVEQQINMNTNLQTLVSIQQAAQSTQALGFVGRTVTVRGDTAPLTNGQAQWIFNPTSPANATFTITNSTGQTVFTQTGTVQPGTQNFNWSGRDNNGQQLPDGNYTLTITAAGTNGQSVAIPTTVTGVVDSADLTQNPPTLSIGGQSFTLNQILSVTQPLGSSGNALSSLGSSVASTLGNLF